MVLSLCLCVSLFLYAVFRSMMKAINRKILRNFWGMKGQAFAIALVIASGVATFIMSVSTMQSLKLTQSVFYRDYHFSEVFSSLKRAPEGLRLRIEEVPGVDRVETRVVAAVNIVIEGFSDPVTGHIYSVSDYGGSILNNLFLRQGRLIEPFRDDEVVIGEAFAGAHGFKPGDTLSVIVNGRKKSLSIVGVALSPEHIYQMPPGAMFPDFQRYGVMWMGRTPLATAYDMEGAFNDVTMTLSDGASLNDVIDRVDELLRPYGGLGTYGRKDQLSHRYLSEEFKGLEQMATMFPIIFLGVAAFLLNVAINRLVSTQREEIAALKKGLKHLARIFFSGGATKVIPASFKVMEFTNESDLDLIDDMIQRPDDLLLGSAHPQGGNRISDDPGQGVVSNEFRVHGYENLYVTDASVFPTNLWANCQATVMAISHYASRFVAT